MKSTKLDHHAWSSKFERGTMTRQHMMSLLVFFRRSCNAETRGGRGNADHTIQTMTHKREGFTRAHRYNGHNVPTAHTTIDYCCPFLDQKVTSSPIKINARRRTLSFFTFSSRKCFTATTAKQCTEELDGVGKTRIRSPSWRGASHNHGPRTVTGLRARPSPVFQDIIQVGPARSPARPCAKVISSGWPEARP